ncbi:cystathione beta-lyase [Eubacterium uniforme]|uniref:cysteine-S-conjugate beta-lyase n=1 Tax=Eubacterium uniforme TaxID=39495 RepID=A0A1T4VJZ0_9FIRM|nr:MalY/PatB family protein [Eubacterium uniforme]SKA65259.1 cystathione beta-lyase [Eubacterium uniforme]
MERNLNFDEIINRKGTDCLKYDFADRRGYPLDVLPFWVADMDFKTSSYIEDALVERAKHGIFGYSEGREDYFNAVKRWMKVHHNWDVERSWLVKTPGVVNALALAVKAYTEVGDGVLIQKPVYYPFFEVIEDNERVVVSNDLVLGDDNKYHIDIKDFEQKIKDNNIKLFFLCNPHNPSSRVFTKEELIAMGDICLKYGVIVVSDEIHNDFVFEGEHYVFTTVKEEYKDITLVCTSISKTFNLASLLMSNIFIPNPRLRAMFKHQLDAAGISQLSVFGLEATKAAYNYGDEWYEAMLKYVKSNIDFVKQYVDENLPGVKVVDGEGTYLVWLDFRRTGIEFEELDRRIINEAKLWLDSGKIFGKVGEGFERINVATPRAIVKECLDRIKMILT